MPADIPHDQIVPTPESRDSRGEVADTTANGDRRRNLRSTVRTYATLGLALAAVLTILFDALVHYQGQVIRQLEVDERIATLLGSDSPFVRASAAVAIGQRIARSKRTEHLLNIVALSAARETDVFVRVTLRDILLDKPEIAVKFLTMIRESENHRAIGRLSTWGDALGDLDNELYADGGAGSDDSLAARRRVAQLMEEVRTAQSAAISASDLIRQLDTSTDAKRPIDLSGLHLRSYPFVSSLVDFTTAKFIDTDLRAADFYGVNLENAKFTGADVAVASFQKANLVGARFDKADTSLPNGWRLGEAELDLCEEGDGSRFPDDLTGVNFLKADLTGANLWHSNITEEQLEQADAWNGAVLPEKLADDLGYTNPPPVTINQQERQCYRNGYSNPPSPARP